MARVRITSEGKPGTKSFRLVPMVEVATGVEMLWIELPDMTELTLSWATGKGVAILTLALEADELELDSEAYLALDAFVRRSPTGAVGPHEFKPGSAPR